MTGESLMHIWEDNIGNIDRIQLELVSRAGFVVCAAFDKVFCREGILYWNCIPLLRNLPKYEFFSL